MIKTTRSHKPKCRSCCNRSIDTHSARQPTSMLRPASLCMEVCSAAGQSGSQGGPEAHLRVRSNSSVAATARARRRSATTAIGAAAGSLRRSPTTRRFARRSLRPSFSASTTSAPSVGSPTQRYTIGTSFSSVDEFALPFVTSEAAAARLAWLQRAQMSARVSSEASSAADSLIPARRGAPRHWLLDALLETKMLQSASQRAELSCGQADAEQCVTMGQGRTFDSAVVRVERRARDCNAAQRLAALGRRDDAHRRHHVRCQRARLVGADDGRAAERLH
jgi:hypothetical protein